MNKHFSLQPLKFFNPSLIFHLPPATAPASDSANWHTLCALHNYCKNSLRPLRPGWCAGAGDGEGWDAAAADDVLAMGSPPLSCDSWGEERLRRRRKPIMIELWQITNYDTERNIKRNTTSLNSVRNASVNRQRYDVNRDVTARDRWRQWKFTGNEYFSM